MKKLSFFLGIAIGLLKHNENHSFFFEGQKGLRRKNGNYYTGYYLSDANLQFSSATRLLETITEISLLKIKLFLKKTHFSP